MTTAKPDSAEAWTPEPWTLDGTMIRPNDEQKRRAILAQFAQSHGLGEAGETDRANAARAWACVNLCTGHRDLNAVEVVAKEELARREAIFNQVDNSWLKSAEECDRLRTANKELLEALEFLFEKADLLEYQFGEHRAVGSAEEQEYWCNGCDAKFVSRWPEWEVNFKHAPECRYVAARAAIAKHRSP